MATKTIDRQTKRLPRVTTPEAMAGPVAGALVGYGGFIAGRVGGGGQRGVALGVAVFIVGIGLALLPGSLEDWRDIGTTAGVASVAGMLLGSLAGGVLAQRQSAPLVAR